MASHRTPPIGTLGSIPTRTLLVFGLACGGAPPSPEPDDDPSASSSSTTLGSSGTTTTDSPTTVTFTTPTPTSTRDTHDTGTETPMPPPRNGAVYIQRGPLQTCADPSEREAGPFQRVDIPTDMNADFQLIGSALVVADFFDDKRPSMVFAGWERTQLFRPVGHRWVDVTDTTLGEVDSADIIAASAADYDGDGDLDLILVGKRQHRLLRNEGEHFLDVTAAVGLDQTDWVSVSASWADLDLDGDLDLMIGNYADYGVGSGDATERTPHPSELYLQEAGGFVDVSHWLPEEVHEGFVFMSSFVDLNEDSYPELFSIHDYGNFASGSRLLLNDGGGGFTIDEPSGFHPRFNGMGFAIGDLNGNGAPDLLQSSLNVISLRYAEPSYAALTGWAWHYEYAEARGLSPDLDESKGLAQVFGWGTELADIDNDGDLDAVMIFGPYFDTPDMVRQRDGLWLQDMQHFTQAGPEWGVDDSGAGRGLVVADVNGDGWLDLVKRQLGLDPSVVHLARCGENSWIGIRLAQPGTLNRFAIGARIDVWVGKQRYRRWITAGSISQFSDGPPEIHVGLGSAKRVDRVEIKWPDGVIDVMGDVEVNRWFRLVRTW